MKAKLCCTKKLQVPVKKLLERSEQRPGVHWSEVAGGVRYHVIQTCDFCALQSEKIFAHETFYKDDIYQQTYSGPGIERGTVALFCQCV